MFRATLYLKCRLCPTDVTVLLRGFDVRHYPWRNSLARSIENGRVHGTS